MAEITAALPATQIPVFVAGTQKEDTDLHPRLADYKARCIKDGQEKRRVALLLEQKQRRSESFNESRGLIEAIASRDHVDDNDGKEDCEMEWTGTEKARSSSKYYHKLMLSEWLVDVPSDLQDLWYMVPCPQGNRTLVVATKGSTKAYNKHGCFMSAFTSMLPGGYGRREISHGYTILDCIWHRDSRTYYILDVLAWNNHSMLDCETEFRFFWLQTKIQETEGVSVKSSDNQYPFILLPHYHCDGETVKTVMDMYPPFPDEAVVLDGILFYHSQCHYKPGTTPLVGWLKPFMCPEKLNIPVAEHYMMMKPEGYQNQLQYIEQQSALFMSKKKNKGKPRKRKSKSKDEKMEVSLNEEQN